MQRQAVDGGPQIMLRGGDRSWQQVPDNLHDREPHAPFLLIQVREIEGVQGCIERRHDESRMEVTLPAKVGTDAPRVKDTIVDRSWVCEPGAGSALFTLVNEYCVPGFFTRPGLRYFLRYGALSVLSAWCLTHHFRHYPRRGNDLHLALPQAGV